MTREEYLQQLRKFLQRLPVAEQEEILADYEEHFRMGEAEGRSDTETAAALGSPMEIARGFYTQRAQGQPQPTASADAALDDAEPDENRVVRSILVLLMLGFFNLVLILPLWLAAAGVILGLFGAGIGLTFGGGAAISTGVAALLRGMEASSALSGAAAGMGLAALGLIILLLTFILGRWFLELSLRYLRWNIDAIRR